MENKEDKWLEETLAGTSEIVPGTIEKISTSLIEKYEIPDVWVGKIYEMLNHDGLMKYFYDTNPSGNLKEITEKLDRIWRVIAKFPLDEMNKELLDGIKSYILFPSKYIVYDKVDPKFFEKACDLMTIFESSGCVGVQIVHSLKTTDRKIPTQYCYDLIRAIKLSDHEMNKKVKYPLKCTIRINQWVKDLKIKEGWNNLTDDLLLNNHAVSPVVLEFDVEGEIEILISAVILDVDPRREMLKQESGKGPDYYSVGFRQDPKF